MVATGAAGVTGAVSSGMGVCAFLAAKMFGLTRITRGGCGGWTRQGECGLFDSAAEERSFRFGFVVSHPFASNHPTDEDLSVGTPGRRKDGARGIVGGQLQIQFR